MYSCSFSWAAWIRIWVQSIAPNTPGIRAIARNVILARVTFGQSGLLIQCLAWATTLRIVRLTVQRKRRIQVILDIYIWKNVLFKNCCEHFGYMCPETTIMNLPVSEIHVLSIPFSFFEKEHSAASEYSSWIIQGYISHYWHRLWLLCDQTQQFHDVSFFHGCTSVPQTDSTNGVANSH